MATTTIPVSDDVNVYEGTLTVSTGEPAPLLHRNWRIGYAKGSVPTVFDQRYEYQGFEMIMPFVIQPHHTNNLLKPRLCRFTPLSSIVENVHFDEAVISHKAELYPCAARQYQRAIETEGYFVTAKVNLGAVWYQLQEWDKAIACFSEVLDEAVPGFHHDLMMVAFPMLYLTYFAAGCLDAAEATLRAQMLYLAEREADSYNALGKRHMVAERFRDAQRAFTKAIQTVTPEEGGLLDAPIWVGYYYKSRVSANLCLGEWVEVKADIAVLSAMGINYCMANYFPGERTIPRFETVEPFETWRGIAVPTEIKALLMQHDSPTARLFSRSLRITRGYQIEVDERLIR